MFLYLSFLLIFLFSLFSTFSILLFFQSLIQNNIGSTTNLLNMMDKYKCKSFVFSSSATVRTYLHTPYFLLFDFWFFPFFYSLLFLLLYSASSLFFPFLSFFFNFFFPSLLTSSSFSFSPTSFFFLFLYPRCMVLLRCRSQRIPWPEWALLTLTVEPNTWLRKFWR